MMDVHQNPEVVVLDTCDFIAIPDNPRQRDTQDRAVKANKPKGHLHQPHPSHTVVSVAVLVEEGEKVEITKEILTNPSFRKWKLDGHTRGFLWDTEALDMPTNVTVLVYLVDSELQAKEFYRSYDSNKAVETGLDKVYSALRDAFGFKPKSKIFKKRGVKTAIEVAFNNNSSMNDDKMYALKQNHPLAVNALKHVDATKNLNPSVFNASVIAAMLLTVLRDGSKAMEFWKNYSEGLGSTNAGYADAIMMAITYQQEIKTFGSADYQGTRPQAVLVGTGRDVHQIYVPMFLGYYEGWVNGTTYRQKPGAKWFKRDLGAGVSVEKFLGGVDYKHFCIQASLFDEVDAA